MTQWIRKCLKLKRSEPTRRKQILSTESGKGLGIGGTKYSTSQGKNIGQGGNRDWLVIFIILTPWMPFSTLVQPGSYPLLYPDGRPKVYTQETLSRQAPDS